MQTSDMNVECLLHMGTDLFVVNCARVTLGKWHPEFLEMEDTRLIKFLAREDHWTPFAHPHVTFRCKAPIFVARQLAKSQVGFVWSEVSRRYVDVTPEFYIPEMRARAPGVKQGSKDEVVKNWMETTLEFEHVCKKTLDTYESMLDEGVAPEVARSILPQSMMTEWIWTGSLYGFIRVCRLRLDHHAQKETRSITAKILRHVKQLFPVSTRSLLNQELIGD